MTDKEKEVLMNKWPQLHCFAVEFPISFGKAEKLPSAWREPTFEALCYFFYERRQDMK